MKKVVKFGGSSLADSEQFKKVGAIITSDPSRVYVIPSAPGKRFSGDDKVTDLLYRMYNKAYKDEDFGEEMRSAPAIRRSSKGSGLQALVWKESLLRSRG